MSRRATAFIIVTVLAAWSGSHLRASPATPRTQGAPSQSLQLAKIDVTGIKRYTAAEVIHLSGLTIGQHVTPADVDAAADKMAQSGFFVNVTYRFATQGSEMSLTLEVAEAVWDTPVVFDNFVWFTDDELTAAVREQVPSFDGTAPASSAVTERIQQTLRDLLRRKGVSGDVDYRPSTNLRGGDRKHIFSVKNPGVHICALQVDGASAVKAADLIGLAKDAVAGDYSRSYIAEFAAQTLTQPYRRAGYWRATFGPPRTTLGAVPGCDGVLLTLRVDEGVPYAWDHAVWIGNSVTTTAQLDALLGFKAGEVANAAKLAEGLRAVNQLHAKQGYLQETASVEPVLDDVARLATFRLTISEGPQYHMGQFAIAGISPSEAKSLAARWALKPGDVFDGTYLAAFGAKELASYRLPPHSVVAEESATPSHDVNVTLTIK